MSTTNGSPITAYKVLIRESGSTTYTQESVDCDGTDASVIANVYCNINIGTLLASPYNIVAADSIYAIVTATNFYGESA